MIEKVREGSAGDIELMDSIDRRTRGAAHGPDHEVMQRLWRLVVSDTYDRVRLRVRRRRRRGRPARGHQPADRARLLWEALAVGAGADRRSGTSPPPTSGRSTSGWPPASSSHQEGYLALRNMQPPAPYLHHGTFL